MLVIQCAYVTASILVMLEKNIKYAYSSATAIFRGDFSSVNMGTLDSSSLFRSTL